MVMSAELIVRFASVIPFPTNSRGRTHEMFAAFQGNVAFAFPSSMPCRLNPEALPMVHETFRLASRGLSLSVGGSPWTECDDARRRRLSVTKARSKYAWRRCVRLGLFVSMAIPPLPLLPAQDPSIHPQSRAKAQGTVIITRTILNDFEVTRCERGYWRPNLTQSSTRDGADGRRHGSRAGRRRSRPGPRSSRR